MLRVVWLGSEMVYAADLEGVRKNNAKLSVALLVEVDKTKEGACTDGWDERLVPGRCGPRMIPKRCWIRREGQQHRT